MKINLIFILIITNLFLNCGSKKHQAKNFTFDNKNENGLLLATITIVDNTELSDGVFIGFESLYGHYDSAGYFGFDLNNYKKKQPDTIINNAKTFYVLGEKKTSSYQLIEYEILKDNKAITKRKLKENNLSIPFTVKKGKINYIGDFYFYPSKNKNGFYFEIRNNLNRDLEKLKKMYPKIEWINVEETILKSESQIIEF